MIKTVNDKEVNIGDELLISLGSEIAEVVITDIRGTTLHYVKKGLTGLYDGKKGWCYKYYGREKQMHLYKI